MKRYRVWEANRKIWLWPENWLEPEFRDDKTHLFQELESALLQGDVSNDLVEDAFFHYLSKLEELAKLDIVTMYCEEKSDPHSNTLHVIGRTFNFPHKYFYRRYAYQMWTPWEPVSVDIESDHVVAVVWRERLHLFWVTFMDKAKQIPNAAENIPDDADVGEVAKAVSTLVPPKEVEIQLNWSEYFQGAWKTRESSGFNRPIRVDVPSLFSRRDVFIYATKEFDGDGEERAVRIQLTGEQNVATPYSDGEFLPPNKFITAFRVVSKHSAPKIVPRDPPQPSNPPYSYSGTEITRYTGSKALEVSFLEKIEKEADQPRPSFTWATERILQQGEDFSLLMCANPVSYPSAEIGILVSPFFYQDDQHTFFVEPSLTETTTKEWDGYAITPALITNLDDDEWWKELILIPEFAFVGPPVDPIDPLAHFKIEHQKDWITNPATVLQFDESLIGQGGGLDFATLSATAGGIGAPVNVSRSSGLNVIGGGGLSSLSLANLGALKSKDLTSLAIPGGFIGV